MDDPGGAVALKAMIAIAILGFMGPIILGYW
jgi:hypothetical protein